MKGGDLVKGSEPVKCIKCQGVGFVLDSEFVNKSEKGERGTSIKLCEKG